jgi:phospho-N-acetylmuramoyl-pentapeptide-transferase
MTENIMISSSGLTFSTLSIFKILWPSLSAFLFGLLITPFISRYLYKNKMWKKKNIKTSIDGGEATITASILQDGKRETPRMGGLVIVFATLLTVLLYFVLPSIFNLNIFDKLNFISRNQTWLPITIFILASFIGLLDDLASTGSINIKNKHGEAGMPLRWRLLFVIIFAILSGAWFFFKLDFDYIHIPFLGNLHLGIYIIPFFILLFLASYGASNIDGLDGLSGGLFSIMFSSYGVIALINNQIDIATLCFVVVGATLAFLWFNISPAKFYLSEVGFMPLAILLAIVAVLTNAALLLIIIAIPFTITEFTTILQLLSKKFRKKKVFPVAPIHNTFVYIGWSKEKVVMRYWIFTAMFALLGIALYIIS